MKAKTVDHKEVQTMTPNQWIRLIVAYLLIPLTLFLCGWDLYWLQAWVFSLLIVSAGIGGRMWAKRLHPGLLAERANFDKARDARAPLVIVAGLDHRYGWSPVFPTWLIILGFILIGSGYASRARNPRANDRKNPQGYSLAPSRARR